MKVTIEFEDHEEAMTAMQGAEWRQVVCELDESLRSKIKHSDDDETVRQEVRDKLHELLNDYNLFLE